MKSNEHQPLTHDFTNILTQTTLINTPKRLKIGTTTHSFTPNHRLVASCRLEVTPIAYKQAHRHIRKVVSTAQADIAHRPWTSTSPQRPAFYKSSKTKVTRANLRVAVNLSRIARTSRHATQPAKTTMACSMAEPTREFNRPRRKSTQIAWLVFAA
jgi:hypothetical protein